MKNTIVPVLVLSVLVGVGAWDVFLLGAPGDEELLDGPNAGLSHAQAHLFIRGDEEFGRKFSFQDGLGPVFNAPSCDSCHPGDGRAHPECPFTRFGRYEHDGTFNPMPDHGGRQLQDRTVPGYPPEALPEGEIVSSVFLAPPTTGIGLLEAVDDSVIIGMAGPEDADGAGISGRVQWVPLTEALGEIVEAGDTGGGERLQLLDGPYVGRFGRKGSNVDLLHQAIGAYNQDMGLTSDFAPRDPVYHTVARLRPMWVPTQSSRLTSSSRSDVMSEACAPPSGAKKTRSASAPSKPFTRVTAALALRPGTETVFGLNYGQEWASDLVGNAPARSALFQLGLAT